ncbi:hypothetical protein GQ42DRAFT_481 [Ramicandelaber brevisporus]|nr:hypothetical protein GQ42DRAFT_481 [Ramicandelaber brevisporus]
MLCITRDMYARRPRSVKNACALSMQLIVAGWGGLDAFPHSLFLFLSISFYFFLFPFLSLYLSFSYDLHHSILFFPYSLSGCKPPRVHTLSLSLFSLVPLFDFFLTSFFCTLSPFCLYFWFVCSRFSKHTYIDTIQMDNSKYGSSHSGSFFNFGTATTTDTPATTASSQTSSLFASAPALPQYGASSMGVGSGATGSGFGTFPSLLPGSIIIDPQQNVRDQLLAQMMSPSMSTTYQPQAQSQSHQQQQQQPQQQSSMSYPYSMFQQPVQQQQPLYSQTSTTSYQQPQPPPPPPAQQQQQQQQWQHPSQFPQPATMKMGGVTFKGPYFMLTGPCPLCKRSGEPLYSCRHCGINLCVQCSSDPQKHIAKEHPEQMVAQWEAMSKSLKDALATPS